MLGRALAIAASVAFSASLFAACVTSRTAREGRGCPIAQRGSASPCEHRGGGPPPSDAGER